MKKKQNNIKISFVDEPAAMDVTGSMIYVKTDAHNILIDAGLHQSNSKYDDLLVNRRRFKEFKSKDIDYIFISHSHTDHWGLVPRLYKEGCTAKIIVADCNANIMHRMIEDSAYIIDRDTELINNQHGKNYDPLYEIDDVECTMQYVNEYSILEKTVIDNTLSFMLIPNGHLPGSVQVLLYLKQNNIEKTLLVTGDIGNSKVHNYYVNKFTPVEHADLVIGESTYGDRPDLKTGQKERNNDIEKLFSIITQQVCELKGQVVIPTFANHRLQMLVTMIYQVMKDYDFPYKVYVDTPLGIDIFNEYRKILSDDELKLFNKVLEWDNLVFVRDAESSKALVHSNEPCVILSTSGMCNNGRIRHHLKKAVPNANTTVLFVGFSTQGSLAALLKDKNVKSISIDNKQYTCRCASFSLKSLSGHAPFGQLVDYYTSINTNRIVLHHGSEKAKLTLKEKLISEFERKCKSTRVIVANSSLKISL